MFTKEQFIFLLVKHFHALGTKNRNSIQPRRTAVVAEISETDKSAVTTGIRNWQQSFSLLLGIEQNCQTQDYGVQFAATWFRIFEKKKKKSFNYSSVAEAATSISNHFWHLIDFTVNQRRTLWLVAAPNQINLHSQILYNRVYFYNQGELAL